MARGYADDEYDPGARPWDLGGAIRAGLANGQDRRAREDARSYADAGDYDRAAYALMDRDPQAAQNYLTWGDRANERTFNREAGAAIASGDYEAATRSALRTGQGVDVVRQIRALAAQADEQQLMQARQRYAQIGAMLIAIEQMPPEQRQGAYSQARSQFLAQYPDTDHARIPEQYSPGLIRYFYSQTQTASEALEAEIKRREGAGEWQNNRSSAYRINPDGSVDVGGQLPAPNYAPRRASGSGGGQYPDDGYDYEAE